MLYCSFENQTVKIYCKRHFENVIKSYFIYLVFAQVQNTVIPECDSISAVILSVKIVMDQLDLWYNYMVLNSVKCALHTHTKGWEVICGIKAL